MEIKIITARIMEMALPKFQSPTEINWDSIRFPNKHVLSASQKLRDNEGGNGKKENHHNTIYHPWQGRFQITFQKVWKRLAPRS